MPIENEFYGYDFHTDKPKPHEGKVVRGNFRKYYRDKIIAFVRKIFKWFS